MENTKENQIEEIKERIKTGNEIHLEETVFLVKELGAAGIGSGFELGGIPCPIKAETENEYKELFLFKAIHWFWEDAASCYKNRRFRACTILLACMLEAIICFELKRRNIFYDPKWTLGELINYCRGETIRKVTPPQEVKKIFSNIIKGAEKINEFRIKAIHLTLEKGSPKEIEKWHDKTPIEKFKSPPATIRNGYITGDDAIISTVFTPNGPKSFIIYKFKKMAMEMYTHMQNILKVLYGLEFRFSFKC